MRLALLCLLALVPTAAHAEALTLMGTLGGREIVVELTQPKDGAVAGRYAFMDTGGDVPLVPVSTDGKRWVLNEEAPCGDDDCVLDDSGNVLEAPIAATWELTYDPKTYLATGTRSSQDGKTKSQPLELGVIAWRSLDNSEQATPMALHDRSAQFSYMTAWPLDWTSAPYEMVLLDIPLAEGDEQALDDATFRYVIDPRTRFAFPRAVAFADGSPVDAANAILFDRHARMNLAALDCLAMRFASYGLSSQWGIRGGHLADYDQESVTLTFLSPTIVSWQEAGSLYCTGAHPYNHVNSYTYDLATGAPLDLSRLLSHWVPREWGAAPDQVADTDLAFENPDAYHWGPSTELIAFVRDSMPAELLYGDELDEQCYGDQALADHLDIRIVAGPAVMFTASGFPHVISVCEGDLFQVPLADLKPFLAPTAADYFPGLE